MEKDSTIMDYQKEKYVAFEAKHRNMCKFDCPSDANFVTMRNSLVTMIRAILEKRLPTVSLADDSC